MRGPQFWPNLPEADLLYRDRDFWTAVDSQPMYRGRSEWAQHRDAAEDECLALNSQGYRCTQDLADGTPFCGFHMDRAWFALLSAATGEKHAAIRREFDRLVDEVRAGHEEHLSRLRVLHALERDAVVAVAKVRERVYFYAVEAVVKIGRSIHPERRVKTLGGTRAPDGIDVSKGSLLGTVPGGAHVEGVMHQRFRRHRVAGEWFRLDPIRAELEALIAEADGLAASA